MGSELWEFAVPQPLSAQPSPGSVVLLARKPPKEVTGHFLETLLKQKE